MGRLLLVALGGVLGATARYGVAGFVHRQFGGTFPLGTLLINLVGCVAIGVVSYLSDDRAVIGPDARLFLAIGVLGSFTTFSTFGYETFAMLQDGSTRPAIWNVVASVGLGIPAVWLGRLLARTF
jgi:fluoride exporter